MVEITRFAKALNENLGKEAPQILGLFSEIGKKAYFPHEGILGQTQEAKGSRINATIGQAYEDDGSPMVLPSLAKSVSIPHDKAFLYSPSSGQKELRELWKRELLRKNPSIKSTITLPIVCSGVTHGLDIVGRLFIGNEDEVIIPDHFWGNYKLTWNNARFTEFRSFDDLEFNIKGLSERLNSGGEKKILLLNFPNNPSGYSPSPKAAKALAKAIIGAASHKKIAVICDDAYFGLAYEDNVFMESMFSLLCDAHENILAIKLDGTTKEAFSWGLRIAFVTYGFKGMTLNTAEILEDKTSGIVRGTVSNCCSHSQQIIIDALKSPSFQKEAQDKNQILKERYLEVKKSLSNPKYEGCFKALPFNSGYFMCLDLLGKDGNEVRKNLLLQKIGVISFGNYLRIAYSSVAKSQIGELFENIYLACRKPK